MNKTNFKVGQKIRFSKTNDMIIRIGVDYTIETVGEDYIGFRDLLTKGSTSSTFSSLKFMQYEITE